MLFRSDSVVTGMERRSDVDAAPAAPASPSTASPSPPSAASPAADAVVWIGSGPVAVVSALVLVAATVGRLVDLRFAGLVALAGAAALAAGYFLGYFLLVTGTTPKLNWDDPEARETRTPQILSTVFSVAALGWLFDTMDQQLFVLARDEAVADLLKVSPTDKQVAAYGGDATMWFLFGWAMEIGRAHV